MTKKQLYLVFQTTRVINALKTFNKIIEEKHPRRFENDIRGKEFIDIVLNHASMIWEVFDLIEKELGEKYRGEISTKAQLEIDKIIKKVTSKKNIEMLVLKDIRNKHSFHIAHDPHYGFSFFSDGPSRYDLKIGLIGSIKEKDILYTLEDEILMSYLMREYNKDEIQIHDIIMSALNKYSRSLLRLFNKILSELVNKKVYIM